MGGALVQHPADHGRHGHSGHEVVAEQLLAGIHVIVDEALAVLGEADVPVGHVGKAQQLQAFGQGEELVHLHGQLVGYVGQVGLAVEGGLHQRLHQAGQKVGGDLRQGDADAAAGLFGAAVHLLGPKLRVHGVGHAAIDVVHQLAEGGLGPVAGIGQVDLHLGGDPAGIGGEDHHPVAHEDGLLDVVGHQQDGAQRQLALHPQVHEVGAQGLGGQHVEGGEWLVHQQQLGMHHQAPGEAHPLAHAAGQLLGIGVLEAVQADQVDGLEGALAPLRRGDAQGLEPDLHVFQHGQPGEQGEALEHHGHPLWRTVDGLALPGDVPAPGPGEACDDPQQGGLAGAGAAQEADDLALPQLEIDAVQHQEVIGLALGIGLADVLDVQHHGPGLWALGGRRGRRRCHDHGALRNEVWGRDQFSARRRAAKSNRGRQSRRLNRTTKMLITTAPSTIRGKSPFSVASAM